MAAHRRWTFIVGLLAHLPTAANSECPADQCLDPDGNCADRVECFADPCEVTQGCSPDLCASNYCGGCHAVCSEAEALPVPEQRILAAADPINVTQHQLFADNLTASMYENENECSSALGVSMAFSLIYPGCTGDAIDQVRDTLGYPAGSNLQLVWNETTQRMLGRFMGQCTGGKFEGVCDSEAPLLKIANSVWFDDNSTLKPNYTSVMGDLAKQIDLGADDSPIIVNEWVENSTNGLIDSIVPEDRPLYPPSELVAINSIYLKASWKHPFDEEKTNLDSFYGSATRNDEVSEAHFMNGVFDGLLHSYDDALPGYQVVRLPFASSEMSMVLVLPINDAVGPVPSSDLVPALSALQPTRVALSMPKFNFESTYDDGLKSAIIGTGISAPFRGGSLCGIFKDVGCGSLFVNKVIQKTVIDVHEIGLEAAAVTAIMLGRSAPKVDQIASMICDHPFQFFVHDDEEGLTLFEGRVGAPGVPGTEPAAPLLNATRSDDDFWAKYFYVDPVDPAAKNVPVDPVVPLANEVDSEGALDPLSSRGHVSFRKRCSLVVGASATVGYAWGLLL